jgi:signal transduction histidine kinase
VEIDLRLGAGGTSVLGDRGQLEQLVINLVINARDAMPSGGVLTIATSLVPGEGEEPRVRLTVRDTGVGMDEETAAHCFEPFFTTKARTKGTGLGLSTAHATIAQAGGTMVVRSRPGAGTTFEIELPSTSPTAPRPAAGPGGMDDQDGSKR